MNTYTSRHQGIEVNQSFYKRAEESLFFISLQSAI